MTGQILQLPNHIYIRHFRDYLSHNLVNGQIVHSVVNLHENVITVKDVRQTLVGSVDLVEPVIVDVCDDHLGVGDAAHLLEGHAEVLHAATFRYRHLVLLRGHGAVLVDQENLYESAEKSS